MSEAEIKRERVKTIIRRAKNLYEDTFKIPASPEIIKRILEERLKEEQEKVFKEAFSKLHFSATDLLLAKEELDNPTVETPILTTIQPTEIKKVVAVPPKKRGRPSLKKVNGVAEAIPPSKVKNAVYASIGAGDDDE